MSEEAPIQEQGQREGVRVIAYTAAYCGTDIQRDLRDIAERSKRNNARDGLTGALLYDRGRFVQVLEGPADRVGQAVSRIARDNRAGTFEVIFDISARARSLPDWSMFVCEVDASQGISVADLRRFRQAYEQSFQLDAEGFLMIVRAFTSAGARQRDVYQGGGDGGRS